MPSRFSRLDDAEALRRFVRDLREGIYVTDEAGRIVDGNPAFLAMLGVASLEDARKMKRTDFIGDASHREAELLVLERRDPEHREEGRVAVHDPAGFVRDVDPLAEIAHEASQRLGVIETGEPTGHGRRIL